MIPLLPAKFYFPPVRASLVPRPRLTERLQAGLSVPLTLISAPAGSGKTTLLSQWHLGPGSGIAAVWLSLEPSDNELARFLQYFCAALDELQPGLREETLPCLQSKAEPDWEAFLISAINLMSGLESPSVLVLDDYHLVENPTIHEVLIFLLDHLPRHLHLILLTRADPPLPLSRLRARGQLLEIRSTDLRFIEEECARFLNQVMGLGLTPGQVAALERRTEGWAAGLQLAALSMNGREDVAGFVSSFTGNNHYIVDFLMEEVLGRQPVKVRQFLLKTSILKQLTGPLCDALTGDENGAEILAGLEHANLFIVPLDDEQRWYRYHHLFADLLRLRLIQDHPDLISGLHLLASRWYEAHGLLLDALDHALAAREMEQVAKIISSNVLILIEGEGARSVLQKIDAFPTEQLGSQPWLGIARAWALGAGQVETAHQILDAVDRNLEIIPDELEKKRLGGQSAAARAFVYFHQGEKARISDFARLAEELLPEDEIAVRALNLTIWGNSLGITQQERGNKSAPMIRHDEDAFPILEKAMQLAHRSGKPILVMMAAEYLAYSHIDAGRFHQAFQVCQEVLVFAKQVEDRSRQPLTAAAGIHTMLGLVLSEWGEYEASVLAAQQALQLNERNPLVVDEVQCLVYVGRILEVAGEWDKAWELCRRAEEKARLVSLWYWQITMLVILNSMLDVDTIDPEKIDHHVRRIRESGIEIRQEAQARLLTRAGHPADALVLLDQTLAALEGRADQDRVRLHVMRAVTYQAMGKREQAIAALRMAIELAAPENRVAAFVREGSAMERLLCSEQARAISPEYVHRLLVAFEARRRHAASAPLATGGLPEPLSGRELEVLKLLARGSSDKEIAEALVIAGETVHKHLKNIYGKLGVHRRTEAIARARELDLLD